MRRKLVLAAAAGLVGAEALVVGLRRGSMLGTATIVRCRAGHLSTTTWIPGASVKALRLGWWRFQRCPVGQHWALVTPARVADLTAEEKELAARHRDTRLP